MIAGSDHWRVVEVLADVTAEGLFDLHEAGEGRSDPVSRVRDVK